MVITNVFDVLPDGVMTSLELKANDVIKVRLKRTSPEEDFAIERIDTYSDNENELKIALTEMNKRLKENNIIGLKIQDVIGNNKTLRI